MQSTRSPQPRLNYSVKNNNIRRDTCQIYTVIWKITIQLTSVRLTHAHSNNKDQHITHVSLGLIVSTLVLRLHPLSQVVITQATMHYLLASHTMHSKAYWLWLQFGWLSWDLESTMLACLAHCTLITWLFVAITIRSVTRLFTGQTLMGNSVITLCRHRCSCLCRYETEWNYTCTVQLTKFTLLEQGFFAIWDVEKRNWALLH